MSYDIGSFVSFFSLNEEFEHVNLNLIEEFVDNCTWYEVVGIDVPNDDFITVRSTSQGDDIPVVIDEYLIHTNTTELMDWPDENIINGCRLITG